MSDCTGEMLAMGVFDTKAKGASLPDPDGWFWLLVLIATAVFAFYAVWDLYDQLATG